jgi:hypothetical protein
MGGKGGHCPVRWEEVEVGEVQATIEEEGPRPGKRRKVRTTEAARMWWTATETTACLAIFSLSAREVDTSRTM